jgi:hypothetical protein
MRNVLGCVCGKSVKRGRVKGEGDGGECYGRTLYACMDVWKFHPFAPEIHTNKIAKNKKIKK